MSYGNRENYNSPAYKAWRFSIFAEFDYTCQLCLRKNVELNAHHIIRVAEAPHLEFVKSNGICLCKECHETRVNGNEKQYEQQFQDMVRQRLILKGGGKPKPNNRANRQQFRGKYRPRNPYLRF